MTIWENDLRSLRSPSRCWRILPRSQRRITFRLSQAMLSPIDNLRNSFTIRLSTCNVFLSTYPLVSFHPYIIILSLGEQSIHHITLTMHLLFYRSEPWRNRGRNSWEFVSRYGSEAIEACYLAWSHLWRLYCILVYRSSIGMPWWKSLRRKHTRRLDWRA